MKRRPGRRGVGSLRIAIDMDDTLADVVTTLFSGYGRPPPPVWLFEKVCDITLERFMRDLGKLWVDEWETIPPTESGLSSSVGRLVDMGHVVDIVSVDFVEQKARWLDRHGIPFRDVISVGRGKDKAGLDYDVFIDDSPVNHAAFMKAGRDSIMYTRSWNRRVQANRRIRSMAEAAGAIASIQISARNTVRMHADA